MEPTDDEIELAALHRGDQLGLSGQGPVDIGVQGPRKAGDEDSLGATHLVSLDDDPLRTRGGTHPQHLLGSDPLQRAVRIARDRTAPGEAGCQEQADEGPSAPHTWTVGPVRLHGPRRILPDLSGAPGRLMKFRTLEGSTVREESHPTIELDVRPASRPAAAPTTPLQATTRPTAPQPTTAQPGTQRPPARPQAGPPPFSDPPLVPPIPLDQYHPRPPAQRSRWIDFAGVDSTIVYEQHQRILYRFAATALGIFVLYIIGGMGAYIFQATDNRTLAIGGALTMGVLVAVAVANVDRSILGSIKVDTSDIRRPIDPGVGPPSNRAYIVGVIARVLIALAASYLFADTIAVELNRKSVQESIMVQLSAQGGALEQNADRIAGAHNAELTSLRQQATLAESELTELLEAPARYEQLARDEEQGRGSTGQPGCGPQCQKWQLERDRALERQSANEPTVRATLADAQQAVEVKEAEIAAEIAADRDETIRIATSPEAMSQAMLDNAWGSIRGFARYFGLMILFFGIEMAVLLIKLIVAGGAYEQEVKARVRLAAHRSVAEYQQAAQEIHEKTQANGGILHEVVSADADDRLRQLRARARG